MELSQHSHPYSSLLLMGFPPGVAVLAWPLAMSLLYPVCSEGKGGDGQGLCLPIHPRHIPEPSDNLNQM